MSGFKTKARTVELLGRKQIRDSVTALAELMKNAYDADAPWLRVEFTTTGSNQHVVIADTGLGMSQNDIESKWLVLGTNSKTKKTKKSFFFLYLLKSPINIQVKYYTFFLLK